VQGSRSFYCYGADKHHGGESTSFLCKAVVFLQAIVSALRLAREPVLSFYMKNEGMGHQRQIEIRCRGFFPVNSFRGSCFVSKLR
jgi:hypothetical protein